MNERTKQLVGNSAEISHTGTTRNTSRERRGKKPHIEYTKICPICGEKFQARTQKAVVCSDRCQYQMKKRKAQAQQAVGTLTEEQRKAIKDIGGAQKIAAMPIRELTKAEKTIGWLSLGVLALSIYDDYQRKQKRVRAEKRAAKMTPEQAEKFWDRYYKRK